MHHFYHCYAAGNWAQIVTEHCDALVRYGLYDQLDTLAVGFVGTDDQIAAVHSTLNVLVPRWHEVARAEHGWEQVTLDALYAFVQDHDGLVSYAHTKGSSRNAPIDAPWRRTMTYHNFVEWQDPVAALGDGYAIAGCYWLAGAAPSGDTVRWVNGVPTVVTPSAGGIFGGNFWWTTCELLRRNTPPDHESRHAAEHWLGQLSEVTPLNAHTVYNMTDFPIGHEPPARWWIP